MKQPSPQPTAHQYAQQILHQKGVPYPQMSHSVTELRASLSQQSRIGQLQTGASGQPSADQKSPITPNLSPGAMTLGQHRVPFMMHEPPRDGRTEPKGTREGEPQRSHESPYAVDPRFAGIDGRPGMPFPLEHYLQPFPKGALNIAIPSHVAVDPKLMMAQGHPEYLASPMIPAMVQHMYAHAPQEASRSERRLTPEVSHPISRPPSHPGMPSVPHALMPTTEMMLRQNERSLHHGDPLLGMIHRHPVMWQGVLAVKNDQATVQMHFVAGNNRLVKESLPQGEGSFSQLRISQRMRLETSQLEGVARRMQRQEDFCMLLAIPLGTDHMDILTQTKLLTQGFVTYFQSKQAAGIVNVYTPGTQDNAYVVHIFPPCPFSQENLAHMAPDLLHPMSEMPHMMIVITTC